jgi:hypothetical protein
VPARPRDSHAGRTWLGLLSFPVVWSPVLALLLSGVRLGSGSRALIVVGVGLGPWLAYLAVSPHTRIRPKGRMTRRMRSNAAAGCFIVAFFTFMLAWSAHDSPTASPAAWVPIFYFGVVLVSVGLWVLRTELTA